MNELFKYSLSINGYKNIYFSTLPRDFTFIVNGDLYPTNRIVADFISPIISKIHISDPTFNTYHLELDNYGDFNEIINLGHLQEIPISSKNIEFVKESFKKLGNSDFYDNFEAYFEQNCNDGMDCPDIYDIVTKLVIKEKLGSNNFNHEIDFISHHFYEIDKHIQIVSKIKPSLLELILQNSGLCLTSEDALVTLLLSLGEEYYHLFEYVYFQEISEKVYLNFSEVFDLNFLNDAIWKSINKRVIPSNKKESDENEGEMKSEEIDKTIEKRYKKKNEIIKKIDNDDYNGIIWYLTQIGQGNPHRRKLMNVTSSTVYFDHNPEFCLDVFEDTFFASEDKINQWILFDFKQNEVIPTHYLLRSQYDFVNNVKSWMIEGSIDGIEWKLMDKRIEVENLREKNVIAKFKIQNPMRCKFVRLSQIGLNWNNNNFLILSGVDFFGKLITFE